MSTNPSNPSNLPPITGRTVRDRRAIENRRIGVWEMLCLGQALDDIAKRFRVSIKTIERDRSWWDERLGYNTQQLKDPKYAAIDVGMTAKKLEKVAEDAYVEYTAATNGAFKVRFLQTVVAALATRHKVLADAGFLPKVGHEKEGAPKVEISFEARFGKDAIETVFDDPKSRRKVLEAAFSMVSTGMLADKDVLGQPLPGHATPLSNEASNEASNDPGGPDDSSSGDFSNFGGPPPVSMPLMLLPPPAEEE